MRRWYQRADGTAKPLLRFGKGFVAIPVLRFGVVWMDGQRERLIFPRFTIFKEWPAP